MKRLLFGVASLVLAFGTTALAADMPVKTPPAASRWNWSGFYLGLNGGYGWRNGQTLTITDDRVDSPDTFVGPKPTGGFGGGQIGYNWQSRNFGPRIVLGIEADIQRSDISGSFNLLTPKFQNPAYGNNKLNYFGTVRGRLGLSFDNSLIYATGGFAYGNVDQSYTYDNRLGSVVTLSSNDVNTGYVVGGGIAYKMTPAWSLDVEYQYINLGYHGITAAWTGPQTVKLPGTATLPAVDVQYNIVRFGLNYHIGD